MVQLEKLNVSRFQCTVGMHIAQKRYHLIRGIKISIVLNDVFVIGSLVHEFWFNKYVINE